MEHARHPQNGHVVAVSCSAIHTFSKAPQAHIQLLAGLGVENDAHLGTTVQHRSRVAVDPNQPNLRQVHLIRAELLDKLAEKGFAVEPGALGENILTRGIDLLHLPRGTRLYLGERACIALTGLRNPCAQIEQFQPGLLAAVLEKPAKGQVIRKAGVMSIVVADGVVKPGDEVRIELPEEPHVALEKV